MLDTLHMVKKNLVREAVGPRGEPVDVNFLNGYIVKLYS